MQKVSKYIYLLLTNVFMFSVVSFLLACLGGDESFLETWFSGMALYGTIISIYLLFIHVVVLILSLILKNNSRR